MPSCLYLRGTARGRDRRGPPAPCRGRPSADLTLELARRFRAPLGDAVEVMEEVHGFPYLDSRDLTGFIDGTENPKGKKRGTVALIGPEDKTFAGESYVFTQRYVHDLARWATFPERNRRK
jgi:putative iron-dependent peroxidase